MPKYEIQQLEIHTRKYVIEGDNLGAAVKKVIYDQLEDGDYQEQLTEFDSINNENGMSFEELSPVDEETLKQNVPLSIESWGVQSIASAIKLEETDN